MSDPAQNNPPQRKIIHIDMDAFYASVEQRDFPEYQCKPLVVGGLPEGRGGVVATASYEARVFGIRSAMPSKQALGLCPHALFVKPRFAAYKEVSNHIREIFSRYTDLIEPLSLDEAYLDVTQDKQGIGSAILIAKAIKSAISEELHLTASAGVSVNKFVAKIASDMDKPNGLTFIGPSAVTAFVEALPVGKFHGVGKVTAAKMIAMGLHTGADIKQRTEEDLVSHFGKAGHFYYRIVRGIDDREVRPHRETKSMGAEDTFPYDLITLEDCSVELAKITQTVVERLARKELKGRTITLKVKYSDFRQITRNKSFLHPVADYETILDTAVQLLAATGPEGSKIRLLGISLSNFGEALPAMHRSETSAQLKLF